MAGLDNYYRPSGVVYDAMGNVIPGAVPQQSTTIDQMRARQQQQDAARAAALAAGNTTMSTGQLYNVGSQATPTPATPPPTSTPPPPPTTTQPPPATGGTSGGDWQNQLLQMLQQYFGGGNGQPLGQPGGMGSLASTAPGQPPAASAAQSNPDAMWHMNAAPALPTFNATGMLRAQRAAQGYGNRFVPYGGTYQGSAAQQGPKYTSTLGYSGLI